MGEGRRKSKEAREGGSKGKILVVEEMFTRQEEKQKR